GKQRTRRSQGVLISKTRTAHRGAALGPPRAFISPGSRKRWVAELSTVNPAAGSTMKRAAERMAVLRIIELSVLAIFSRLPLFLADYLTVFFTRVLILSLLAISFDLVWGYAGILSFGQALFYGTAAYSVALMARDLGITSIFIVLPASLAIGFVLSYLIACF